MRGRKALDLVGKRIGRLVVVSRGSTDLKGQIKWNCLCDCGIVVSCFGGNLRKGTSKSCGCLSKEQAKKTMALLRQKKREEYEANLVGQRFTYAVVLSRSREGTDGQGCSTWNCLCDCGRTFTTRASGLVYGSTKSCGCWRSESRKKEHGLCMRNHFLATYKAAAKRRGYKWGLSEDEFFGVTQQPCHYCGIAPSERKDSKRYNGGFVCNGVDRKDNTQGYLFANVVPACKVCNYAKGTMSYEEYKTFLIRAGKFQLQLSTVE